MTVAQIFGRKDLKVAVFSTLWGSSTGGIDVCSKELILALTAQPNTDVCGFYKIRTQQLLDDAKKNGFLVITPSRNLDESIDPSHLGPWTELEASAAIPKLLVEDFRPDVVIINDIFGRELIHELRQYFSEAKIVTLFHSAYGRSEAKKDVTDSDVVRKENYQRELIEKSDFVFSVGSFSEAYLRSLSSVSSDKINHIIPGLPNIQSQATKSKKFNASSFGRLDKKSDTIKQISISAEAWARARASGQIKELSIEDVSFSAIGSRGTEPVIDEVKKSLQNTWQANLRELPFEEIENFEQSELKGILDRSAFVLLNSWYENFGLTFLETCTFGVPTVISESSGFFVDAQIVLGDDAKDLMMSVKTDGVPSEELIGDIERVLIAASAQYEKTFDKAQGLRQLLLDKWPSWSDAAKKILAAVQAEALTVPTEPDADADDVDVVQGQKDDKAHPWPESLKDLLDWSWSRNILYYNNLSALPDFKQASNMQLTPLQKKFWDSRDQLLQSGFKDVVLSGGTSSGKTTLAEVMFGLARPNEFARTRILYVAPTKALAQEKARSWKKKYPSASLGRGNFDPVIVSTGDDNASDGALIRGEFNIASTVYEKANVILSASQELFEKINLVIIDEFHMVEDLHRGTIIESLLAKIRKEKERRLKSVDEGNHLRLAIITTEGTSKSLEDYLTYTDYDTLEEIAPLVIADSSRATKVDHSAFFPGKTDQLKVPRFDIKSFDTNDHFSISDAEAQELSSKHALFQNSVNRISDAAKIDRRQLRWDQYGEFVDLWFAKNPQGRRLLVFMNSKYEIVEVAKFLKNRISKKTFMNDDTGTKPLGVNEDGLAKVALSLDEVEGTDFVKDLRRCLNEGVFIHDADVPQSVREAFENYLASDLGAAFRSEVVIATETLSYGVNLRVSDVALFNVLFPEGERIQTRRPKSILLSRCDFVNMSGRAGRLGQVTNDGSANVHWYLDSEEEPSFEAVVERFYVQTPEISSNLFHKADTSIALDYQKKKRTTKSQQNSSGKGKPKEGLGFDNSEPVESFSTGAVERYSYPFVRTVLDGLRFLGGSEGEIGFLEKVGCSEDELMQEYLSKTFYHREKCEYYDSDLPQSAIDVRERRSTYLADAASQILESAKSDNYGLVREPRTGGYQITALGSSTIDTGTEIATVSQLRQSVIELRRAWVEKFDRPLPFELAVLPVFFQPEVHRQYLLRLPEFNHAMDWNRSENRSDLLSRTCDALSKMDAINDQESELAKVVANGFLDWTVENQPIVSEQGRYEEAAHDACLRLYLAFLTWISGASLREVIGEVQQLYSAAPTKTEASVFNFEAFADNLTWKILFLISLIRTSGETILPPSSTFDAVRFVHRARFGCDEKAIPLLFKNKNSRPPLNRVKAHQLLSKDLTTASIALGALDETSGLNQVQINATRRQVRQFIDESYQEISRQFNYLAAGGGQNRRNEESAKAYWDYSRSQISALLGTGRTDGSVTFDMPGETDSTEGDEPSVPEGERHIVIKRTTAGIQIDVFTQTIDADDTERVVTSRTMRVFADFVFDEADAVPKPTSKENERKILVDFPWATGSMPAKLDGRRLSPAAFGIVLSLCARNFVVDPSAYLNALTSSAFTGPIGVRQLYKISEPHLRTSTFPEAIFESWAKYIEVGEF
ncbi:DEAD/DEAH box helicase [Ascidiaceihabitans sp.]|uniref:DEAD/DEAH box helicase n=1 Tax=Ascidiaceihabitans sp. TaxID=1872644 RepID=UPI0032991BFA